MLCQSLAWRRHHHIDTILETWNPPEHLLDYYCGGWHHYDKGILIIFISVGEQIQYFISNGFQLYNQQINTMTETMTTQEAQFL